VICLLIAYWGFNILFKSTLRSTNRSDAALKIQLYSLEKRVEELERKLNNK